MSFICKRDSKKYCMACEHYEACDSANRCNGDCKNCDDTSCENNIFFPSDIDDEQHHQEDKIMNITKEQKKEKAIELLKKLNIYEPYIDGFRKDDQVCFFERCGGYWVYQEPELQRKMNEIEKAYDCAVYAITHEFAEFGECYSFLIVTDYTEEWDRLIQSQGSKHYAFAYVWNKDDDSCSEFGIIGVHSFGGGIARFA